MSTVKISLQDVVELKLPCSRSPESFRTIPGTSEGPSSTSLVPFESDWPRQTATNTVNRGDNSCDVVEISFSGGVERISQMTLFSGQLSVLV